MMRLRFLLTLPALALAAGAAGGAGPVADLAARLAGAVAAGDLDPAVADLYRLYAAVAPERLPPAYRAEEGLPRAGVTAPAPAAIRCGTPVLRAVEARLPELPADLRADARALLAPERALLRTVTSGEKTVDTALPNWIVTENFSFEWGPDLTDEDGSAPPRDADGDGVPDVVELWASYFEASFEAVAAILYPDDPAAATRGTALDTNLVPVYLGNSDPTTLLDDIGVGTYGVTHGASPVPYIQVNNDFSFVPPNQASGTRIGQIRGAMRITAAHEFFHVLHFLYEPSAWNAVRDDWWFEASSTWMEDEVFDEVNDYYQYFDGTALRSDDEWTDFVEEGLPVRFDDPYYVTRAYGNVIFPKYLGQHVAGRAAMGEIWDRIRFGGRRILYDNPENTSVGDGALGGFAGAHGFAGVGELFLGFAGANATMDYEEGENFGSVPVRGPLAATVTAPDLVPAFLGVTYRRDPGDGAGAAVTLVGSPGGAAWGLTLVGRPSAGAPPRVVGSAGTGGTSLAFGSYAELWAVPSFLDPAAASTGYQTVAAAGAPADATPPPPVAALTADAAPGGFDLAWTPSGAVDLAGHVISWTGPGTPGARTVVAPVSAAEVRALPTGTYEVAVLPYDAVGNGGGARTTAVTVTEPSPVTPTPVPTIADRGFDDPVPDGGGGGGGGGGGCFLRALGPPP